MEPCEHANHGAVARWCRGVVRCLGADDHGLGAVRRIEIAAGLVVPIIGIEGFHEAPRIVEEGALARDLEERERRPRHVGVVVEKLGLLDLAVSCRVAQPAALPHDIDNVVVRPLGHREPGRLGKNDRSLGQRRDHEAVPIGQHLVVP